MIPGDNRTTECCIRSANDRFRVTQTTLVGFIITLVIACLSLTADAQIPNIPRNVRQSIELTLGAKGIYIPSEAAFKVRMVRNDIQQTEVMDHVSSLSTHGSSAITAISHPEKSAGSPGKLPCLGF